MSIQNNKLSILASMNQIKPFCLIVLCFCVSMTYGGEKVTSHGNPAITGGKVIYLSPSGNDRFDGSINHPLLTISAAQAKVRLLKKKGNQDITVLLRGGNYPISRTLVFGTEDSGERGASDSLESIR